MNYDLCSGTCIKKSGIYSVAMFQKTPYGNVGRFSYVCAYGKAVPGADGDENSTSGRSASRPVPTVQWTVGKCAGPSVA